MRTERLRVLRAPAVRYFRGHALHEPALRPSERQEAVENSAGRGDVAAGFVC